MSNPNPNKETRFKKGQSGNPAGKPVGAKSFTTKVTEALERIAEGQNYTYEEALIKSILKKAIIDGDAAMIRLIWNYKDGMPMQKLEHSGDVNIIPIYGGNSIISKYDSDTKNLPTPKENPGSVGGDIGKQDNINLSLADRLLPNSSQPDLHGGSGISPTPETGSD